MTREADRVLLPAPALAAVAATFLLMGALAAAYGPLLEHFARRFEVSLAVAGSVLSAHFAGALVGVIVSMRAMEWVSVRLWAGSSLGCLAACCAGVALAGSLPVLLVAVFVIGLGFGALGIGLNQLVAHSRGARRSALLNALNGAYGIGAVAAPVLVSTLGAGRLAILYVGGAVLAVGLVPALAGVSGRLPVARGRARGGLGLLVAIFVLAFVLYNGTENGVGGWMTSHLESLGIGTVVAAASTSAFWLAMALGRLLMVLVPPRVPEPGVVLSCSALGAAALLGAAVAGSAAPFAYVLAGLAIAPVFPTGIVWLAKLRPGDSRTTSWLFPAGMLGGAVVPGGIGVVIGRYGIGWAPAALSVVAVASFAAFSLARGLASVSHDDG